MDRSLVAPSYSARCRDLLSQDPVQAANRADLREKLRVAGGGVVFTTIQKFMPAEQGDRNAVLSDRRNPDFEEVTEGEEVERKEGLKS